MKALVFGDRFGPRLPPGLEAVREPAPDVVAILTVPAFSVDAALIEALPKLERQAPRLRSVKGKAG